MVVKLAKIPCDIYGGTVSILLCGTCRKCDYESKLAMLARTSSEGISLSSQPADIASDSISKEVVLTTASEKPFTKREEKEVKRNE